MCENGGGTPKVPPVPCRTRFRSGENAAVLNARAPLMRLLPLSAGVFHGLVRHLVVPVWLSDGTGDWLVRSPDSPYYDSQDRRT